jgi:hypothetical protein
VALAIIPLLISGMLFSARTVSAAGMISSTANNSETVTVSSWDTTPFTYASQTPPTFKVIVTFATRPAAVSAQDVSTQANGTGNLYVSCCNPTASSDGLTYTFKVPMSWTVLPPGNDYVIAKYTDPSTHTSVQSSPYSFTVNKGATSFQCTISNYSAIFNSGYTLDIQMTPQSGDPDVPVDWQHTTYTVKFVGPTTVTQTGLVPNSNDVVTVPAPTQYAYYSEVDCTFNGTNLFAPATTNAVGQPVLVSQEQQLGGIQLFTNPTTLASNRSADLYVVLHAASGGPTPTGAVGFTISRYYSANQTIGSDGMLLVHTTLPNLNGASEITISYTGDPYYNVEVVNFPLTNPPIPGGSGGNGGSGGHPTSTPSKTPTSSPTGITSGGNLVPTPATAAPKKPLLASASAANAGLLWWIVLLCLLLVGGVASGVLVAVRRGRASSGTAGQTAVGSSAASAATADVAVPTANHETES